MIVHNGLLWIIAVNDFAIQLGMYESLSLLATDMRK